MSDNEEYARNTGGILTSIDSEQLIKEIEKRPALYNKQLKEYSDRNIREKMWGEVCTLVVPNWSKLAAKDKEMKGEEVQKKWKNLKDCFQREVATQRRTTLGQKTKKRRKYIHFDDLLFLLPFVKGKETSNNVPQSENDGVQHNAPGVSSSTKTNELSTPVKPCYKKSISSYETLLLEILKSKQNDEENEDKHFALMLVPMMGRLNDDQKHYAKIEILNVMRDAANFQPPQPAYSQSFQRHSTDHVQHTENRYRQCQNTESHFHSGFAAEVLLPSSTSESDVSDTSNQ